ncbi:MAG: acyl carrier protein [Defluviitaleaceae bacterium]|nr:acyl carrier protein [Defluviitaleaceae bacterium]
MMVFEKVRTIIAEQMSVDEAKITPETSLANDIGADSLDIFQMISVMEEEFDMEFLQDSAETIKTVNDLVAYIEAAAKK